MDEMQRESATESSTGSNTANNAGSGSYTIPLAILFGFGMIAVAIYFSGGKAPATVQLGNEFAEEEQLAEPIPELTAEDHILGNPNAPIVIVEYSDFDCPFCKAFHSSMHEVMDIYGPTGKVAWAYRHFPLENIHPSAGFIAAASECVAEIGGNESFWKFADLIFGERETNAQTDTTRLPEFAVTAGVDESAYTECVESERTVPLVEADLTEALNAGVTGTPFSFIMIAGQQLPVNGAQPAEFMISNIESLLEQLEKAEANPSE